MAPTTKTQSYLPTMEPLVLLLLLAAVCTTHKAAGAALDSSLVTSQTQQTPPKAPFCKSYECPRFTSHTIAPDTELRTYPSTLWASTSVTRGSTEAELSWGETSVLFRRLFRYITGDNLDGTTIAMTVPVLMRYQDV